MIVALTPRIAIGNMDACTVAAPPIIHACRVPCYMKVSGHTREPSDPWYLDIRRNAHLYMNLLDPITPLFYPQSFLTALDFIDEFDREQVVVHCNRGESRAPTIALLWLAKRGDALASSTYEHARQKFRARFPEVLYAPGPGISTFLERNWNRIR